MHGIQLKNIDIKNELKKIQLSPATGVSAAKKKKHENIIKLHRQLSCIVQVISCTSKVNTDKFGQLCVEVSLNLANNFPWASWNHTLHSTCMNHKLKFVC